jgi:hypothetical protein
MFRSSFTFCLRVPFSESCKLSRSQHNIIFGGVKCGGFGALSGLIRAAGAAIFFE